MTDSTCERCQSAQGTPHTFHYGKKAGLPAAGTQPIYRSTVRGHMHAAWTEHYEDGGIDVVYMCESCLRRARSRRTFKLLWQQWFKVPAIAILYALWAVGVVVWTWQGDWTQVALWLGAGLGSALVAYAVVYLMLETEDFARSTAVQLHEEKLRSQGWDSFWTEVDKIGLLTPH